ncbi:class I SAM-dependent RNA methyltransferase [Enemella sp. A6]|uniref:class I SAM-dependent RNA methyltransferase n=1 Tax=Enemella sp. A6 TaxID=3440152 RepID=UPI003EBC8109
MTDPNERGQSEQGPSEQGPIELTIGPIAHGGHWVARHDGRVVFVRHVLEGERVVALPTDTTRDRFWRADAVEVLQPAPERVTPVCPIAGRCGGCDFQHVDAQAQRDLKTAVLAEQLDRLAGVQWAGTVQEVPGGSTGWRTRMHYRTDEQGRLGMRAHRSHDLVPLPDQGCAIAARQLPRDGWPPHADVRVVGESVLIDGELHQGPETLTEHAAGRTWQVAADGFWQVHPHAADVLSEAVIGALDPQTGERVLDLYCGVGLFAGVLADHGVTVQGVENNRAAVELAGSNVPEAEFIAGRVERTLPKVWRRADVVVLDPPRAGAGRAVVDQIVRRRPRAVAYVACDPAALARDVAHFADRGYHLAGLRAFDLFPMTHHIEAVAQLLPAN